MSTPQFDSEDVLECARSIRPYLPELAGAEAETIDRQLADLLAQAKAGESVDAQILELLTSRPKTRNWAAEFLAPKQVSKGFEQLPGSSDAVSAPKFVCPQGDYVWYQRSIGIPIPVCPSHPELGELIPG
jgi:hypothetical protein